MGDRVRQPSDLRDGERGLPHGALRAAGEGADPLRVLREGEAAAQHDSSPH